MIGFFRDNDIYRFDVIGAAEAIFCVREDSLITSLNKKECKELTITLEKRLVQRVYYRENVKSTLYPLYELKDNERQLANFKWRGNERPNDRFAITTRSIRPTAVDQFEKIAQPTFPYTQRYFPGHIHPKEPKEKVAHLE
jgi:hypothetical protein